MVHPTLVNWQQLVFWNRVSDISAHYARIPYQYITALRKAINLVEFKVPCCYTLFCITLWTERIFAVGRPCPAGGRVKDRNDLERIGGRAMTATYVGGHSGVAIERLVLLVGTLGGVTLRPYIRQCINHPCCIGTLFLLPCSYGFGRSPRMRKSYGIKSGRSVLGVECRTTPPNLKPGGTKVDHTLRSGVCLVHHRGIATRGFTPANHIRRQARRKRVLCNYRPDNP